MSLSLPMSVVQVERRFLGTAQTVVERVQNPNLPPVSSLELFARIVVAILHQAGSFETVLSAITEAVSDWQSANGHGSCF